MVMESLEGREGDKAFDEAVLMVQQQITTYKERTSKKLQKLKATIEVARKMMVGSAKEELKAGGRFCKSFWLAE